jgi:membrane-associated phospholipid phosphatase
VSPLVVAVLLSGAAVSVAGAEDDPPAVPAAAAPATTPAPAQSTSVPPAGPPPPHTGVKATLRAIPGDFRHLPSRHTAAVLGGGAVLALAAHTIDDDVNAHLRGSSTAKTFFAPGKVIGQGATLLGASFAVYGIGRATGNDKVSHLGMDLLRATVEDAAIVYAIKLSVRRDRPTGECCSFPSGHASVTFAAAAVLWRHLGWKAAVPTYTVASYVALSRLHDTRHFLSDVIFGYAIGVAVGHTVTLHTLRGHEDWAISPLPLPGGGIGVMVSRN